MTKVFISGVGMTRLGKHPASSVKQLAAQAIDLALKDAAIGMEEIQAAWFCNTRQGVLEGQHGIRGQCALRPYGIGGIPIFNTDNACASSSSGVFQAYAAVRAGLFETVLVVGAEKMIFPERRNEMFAAFSGSVDRDLVDKQLARLQSLIQPPDDPAPGHQPAERSLFMDLYAAQARLHMQKFGTTQDQIAEVAAKNHWHSQFNPLAQYQSPMSKEEVLKDRVIAWPMTKSMCAPMSDGAAALILTARSSESPQRRSRAVLIRGIGVSSSSARAPEDYDRHLTRTAANVAYEAAGIGPKDISFAEVHDATAFAEILQTENLGFCEYGGGGQLAASGRTRLGGELPVNVSGGLVSKGHPIGATGAVQLFELVTQLRGEAGARQVTGARFGLAENGGGFYDLEEAACVVTILEGSGPAV